MGAQLGMKVSYTSSMANSCTSYPQSMGKNYSTSNKILLQLLKLKSILQTSPILPLSPYRVALNLNSAILINQRRANNSQIPKCATIWVWIE